jgi:tRNA 2-thiouridine synthesizing protein A
MKELNACGLNCPMPLLKAKQALNQIQSGEQLLVLATDKGSWRDFEVYTQQSGHELLERRSDNGVYRYIIRKK